MNPPRGAHRAERSAAASADHRERWLLAGVLAVAAIAFVDALTALHDMYLSQAFGFHDLGLLNDAIGSMAVHGRPFHVHALDLDHLRIHFTPTLFLLAPLYRLVDSQFLLLALNVAAMFGAFACFFWLLRRLVLPVFSWPERAGAYVLFGLVCHLGVFNWNVMTSGHFEVFFTLLGAGLVLAMMIEARFWIVGVLFVLCLGVRQDAGFFLAFILGSLALLPRSIVADRWRMARRAVPLAVGGAAYTVFAAKFILPWLGTDETWHARRFWSHFGGSFEEIAQTMLRQPHRVVEEAVNSAFWTLNSSFLWVPFAVPWVGALTNVPGLLFYTMSAPERKFLYWYNSSYLLVGLFLGFIAGICVLRSAVQRLPLADGTKRGIYLGVVAALSIGALVVPGYARAHSTQPAIDRTRFADSRQRIQFVEATLRACPQVSRVATDFTSFVFLPNRVAKYLPDRFGRADAVFVFAAGNPILSPFASMEDFERSVTADGRYRLAHAEPGRTAYVKLGSFASCGSRTGAQLM